MNVGSAANIAADRCAQYEPFKLQPKAKPVPDPGPPTGLRLLGWRCRGGTRAGLLFSDRRGFRFFANSASCLRRLLRNEVSRRTGSAVDLPRPLRPDVQKKVRARDGAGSVRHPEAARGLVRRPRSISIRPPRVYRRDIGLHQHGPPACSRPTGRAAQGRHPA